ncbi:hypothetical protein EYC87_17995 [Halieaceae bacterium IMCC8485]|jgi:hypothetical protein|uniref:Extradiol ring-cleavage dioxygenase LigAB LigA subunit domain-containing protein n=1 Tax=Candidatus Seongchinamella marina TaxID=2518990 RepID=A0ABT3SZN9_9GAMM|nr:hypothetical protein [Candidatus Seongchinamella marina]MCX2975476.1 hypothetical protein [Candidatus Seongchinamella marina]
MSVNTVERILWEFGENPERIGQFQANPVEYLSHYQLDDEESKALTEVDLKTLAELGVSTLLTMMVWPMINGPEGMPFAYLDHMSDEKVSAPPAS